nr:hypothetical protein [Streptomyces benahoarensis]
MPGKLQQPGEQSGLTEPLQGQFPEYFQHLLIIQSGRQIDRGSNVPGNSGG